MMPYLLLLIGLILLYLEFYLPSGIVAAAGGIVLMVSIVVFANQATSPFSILAFALLSLVGLAGVVWLALSRIRKTAKQQTFYLESDQKGYIASSYDETAIGKKGIALSDLKPAGHALVEGKRYQVVSESDYITEGSPIEVIGGRGAYLIVKSSQPLNH